MNLTMFLKQWWSGANLDYRYEVRDWMARSYADPFTFWEELFSYTPKNSTLFERYDFYADCVLKHLGENLIALKVVKEKGEIATWTYEQIDSLVNIQTSIWMHNDQLRPQQTVALVLPYGVEFLVSLLTALRLGLVITILPTKDRFFSLKELSKALELIKPRLIVTTEPIPTEYEVLKIDLSLEKSGTSSIEPYSYQPDEITFKHFNPHIHRLTSLEATRSYLLPLRDATLALSLKPTLSFARPLSSVYREEPFCTLMALLTGATILQLEDPSTLKDVKIDVLGVNQALQQLWMRKPVTLSKDPQLWYRSPLDGNFFNWKAFSELNHLAKIPQAQLILEREKGGFTFFSQPKILEHSPFLHPSLGTPWKLLEVRKTGKLSTEGFGYFRTEPETESDLDLLIAQISDEWMISSSKQALREGYRYPQTTVEEAIKPLDFVQTCMVVAERHPQQLINQQFTLIVFVSPQHRLSIQQQRSDWTQAIQTQIEQTVGKAYFPDNIAFYSLYPKMEDGLLNRTLVEEQYRNGSLYIKQERSIYHLLNLLKESVYEKTTH